MIGLLIIASILFSACLATYGWRVLQHVETVSAQKTETAAAMEKLWELFQLILVSAVIGQFFSIGAMFILPTVGGLLLFFCIVFLAAVLINFHRSYLRGRIRLF